MIHLPSDLQQKLTLFDSYQSESFLFLNENILGVEIQNMTIKHFLILDGIESAFLKNHPIQPEDVGLFLWVLSPKYSTDENERKKFFKEIVNLDFKKTIKEIEEYLIKTFQDADDEESDEKGYANFVSYLIDLFAREYHWTISEIMNLPLRVVYQLITAIQERSAKLNGESYSKLRQIDELINKHILNEHKKNSEWHSQNT